MMTEQERLVDLIDSLAIRAEILADQTRKLKSVVEVQFAEDHLLGSADLEDWRKLVSVLLNSTDIFSRWAKLDTEVVDEFLTRQLKDQVNAESSIESKT